MICWNLPYTQMNMKLNLKTCVALVALHGAGVAFAGREGWSSDFAAAKKEAAESKKDLLVDFTGSDWCAYCIKLNQEVFSQELFKTGVKDKFVLVELDFPKNKALLDEATITQNTALGEKYAIPGFPTLLLCDSDGKPYAVSGYEGLPLEAFMVKLDQLHDKKAVRDEAFRSAASATGLEKAKTLIATLDGMDLNVTAIGNFYGDVVAEIRNSDPTDETGFAKATALKERIAKFQREIKEFVRHGDFDGAHGLVDVTLKEGGFERDQTQQLMGMHAMLFAQQKKLGEAIIAIDEAKAYAPDSGISAGFDNFKARVEAEIKKAEQGAEAAKPAAG